MKIQNIIDPIKINGHEVLNKSEPGEKLIVESDGVYSRNVVLRFEKLEITVSAAELTNAIKNALNQ